MMLGGISLAMTQPRGAGVPPSDSTPDAFAFTDVIDCMLSTVYASAAITVAGIDTAADITVTGGEYSINGGAYTSAAGTVVNGDTVAARGTSSGSASTAVNVAVTIGGVSDTFSITTSIAEAAALFARITSEPVQARRTKIRTFIASLLTGATSATNIWAKLDVLQVYAAADAQASLLNWKGDVANATATSTFAANQGYTGDGASTFVATGYNPGTFSSPQFAQNSAMFGIYSLTTGQVNTSDAGWFDGTDGTTIQCRNPSNICANRINNVTQRSTAGGVVTDGSGLFTMDRFGSTSSNVAGYRNGVELTMSSGSTSTAVNNGELLVGTITTAAFSTRQFAGMVAGGHLVAAEHLDLYNAFAAYLSGL